MKSIKIELASDIFSTLPKPHRYTVNRVVTHGIPNEQVLLMDDMHERWIGYDSTFKERRAFGWV